MNSREIKLQRIQSDLVPRSDAVPSGQAVVVKGLVFCSGQIAIDASTGQMIEGDLEAQIRQALTNLENLLIAAGSSLHAVVKMNIYLRDLSRVREFNAIYAALMPRPYPPRTVVEVSRLARDALVELDAIAACGE